MPETPRPQSESRLRFVSAGATSIGQRRKRNEDSYLADDALGLWLVADGMGGHASGDFASRESAESLHCEILRLRSQEGVASLDSIQLQLEVNRAVQTVAYQLYGLAEFDVSKMGMGTTLSAVVRFGDAVVLAHVGDSRVYLFRGGDFTQLTEDHTVLNQQRKAGVSELDLGRLQRQAHMITRAVGPEDHVPVDTEFLSVRLGDRLLLCSDGLHGYFDDAELSRLLVGERDGVLENLLALANRRGGRDNITAVLVDVEA